MRGHRPHASLGDCYLVRTCKSMSFISVSVIGAAFARCLVSKGWCRQCVGAGKGGCVL